MGAGVCGGASFVSVNGEAIDLTEITVTGYKPYAQGGEGSAGEVAVQTLTAGGGRDKEYQWFDDEEGAAWFRVDDGSYDEVQPGDVPLEAGEGLWTIVSISGDRFLQTSGEVPTTADIETALDTMGKGIVIANPTPVDVDVTDCYVTGYTPYAKGGEGSAGEVAIQTLTAGGGRAKEYQWFDDEEGAAWFRVDDGSYDELQPEELVRKPGEGLWAIVSVSGNRNFVWPKVEVK